MHQPIPFRTVIENCNNHLGTTYQIIKELLMKQVISKQHSILSSQESFKNSIQYHPIILVPTCEWIQIISLPRLPDSNTAGLGIPSTMPVFSPSEGVLHFQLHVCRVNILRINSLNPWTLTYLNTLMSSCTSSNSSK